MDDITIALITIGGSLLGSLLLSLPGWLAFRSQLLKARAEKEKLEAETDKTDAETNKTEAETAQIYASELAGSAKREIEAIQKASAAERMSIDCQRRVDKMESDFDDLIELVVNWVEGIGILSKQLSKFEEPAWTPKESERTLIKKLCEGRAIHLAGD